MSCDSLIFWRPVPVGSVVKVQAAGDQNKFNVVSRVGRNGVSEMPPLLHGDIFPGPAVVNVHDGDRISLDVTLVLFDDVEDPVTLTIQAEDESGNVLEVPDENGDPMDAKCEWQISQEIHSPMMVTVLMGP